jgi:hypothetical protein
MPAIARYSTCFGLQGCYLPDSRGGPVEFTRRRDLAVFIRAELEAYDLPSSLFREVNIARLWAYIKRHGSSSAHFHLSHKGYALSFIGLTEDEFNAQNGEDW